jgi:predicted unusual protein kinase regulating ubiquinone biosynthesis (AarF/ABC1/UbiB family)
MTVSAAPSNLRRYAEIGRVLLKHGRSDLVRQAGLDTTLARDAETPATRAEADELAADLERLGPTFIKLGQLLSTRADLLPAPYLDALARLQDSLEPVPFDEIRQTLEEELCVRLPRLFPEFDEIPLATASIGQVHRAALRDGAQVVVKVQRPGVRQQVFNDLEVLESIADRLERHTHTGGMLGFSDILAQFRRSLIGELDYRREAAHLVRLGEIAADYPALAVPAPYDDLTSGRVLTMDYLPGRKITEISPVALLDVDGPALARALFDLYLDQILVEGFFHADPHPGNLILIPDGRIGIVDLGMVARVPPALRDQLIRLLVALSEGRPDDAAKSARSMCEAPPDRIDDRSFDADIADIVDRASGSTLEQLDVGHVVLDLTRACAAAGLRPPPELSMVGKALLNLDMVARKLDPDLAPVEVVRERGIALLSRASRPSLSGMVSAAMDARDFAEQLPGRLNRAMDALTSGQFQIKVDAFDEGEFLRGLHRVANRVATGLVLSALIIGAALLTRVHTSARVAGYPALAFVVFLLAAVGGAYLIVSIVIGDRKIRRR